MAGDARLHLADLVLGQLIIVVEQLLPIGAKGVAEGLVEKPIHSGVVFDVGDQIGA